MFNLTLFVPGLLGPDSQFAQGVNPGLKSLERLLARSHSNRLQSDSYYHTLCDLFGLETSPEKDIPVAAISRLIDAEEPPHGYWMRADPVHLVADQNGLVLVDASAFSLSQHDALALAADIKERLEESGWELEVPVPGRWYIKLDSLPDISTVTLDKVIGHDIQQFLPRGKMEKKWRQLLNEIQMQMHCSEVNRNREKQGDIPVNSLWFWGLGELPVIRERFWSRVYGDDVFVQGLAMLSATPCLPLTDFMNALTDNTVKQANILVVMNNCQQAGQYYNLEAWRESLLQLEANLFKPVLAHLKSGKLNKLKIVSTHHAFISGKLSLYKFWKKIKPVGKYQK